MFNVERSISLGILALLVMTTSAWADQDLSHSQQAIHAFNQGVEAFNAKDCNTAVDHFSDAISADSDFAEAYYARGACRYSLQSTDGAMMDLSDAIRLKPELVDARALRGVVYYQSERWDEALADFNAVLDKNPHEGQSLLGRGVIRLKREDIPGAEKDFRTFLKLYPTHPYAAQLHKILATLKGAEENATPETGASADSGSAPAAAPKSLVRRSRSRAEALADTLLRGHEDMSDQYTRSVLRGDRGQAVGDISRHTGQSAAPPNGGGVDVVSPNQ